MVIHRSYLRFNLAILDASGFKVQHQEAVKLLLRVGRLHVACLRRCHCLLVLLQCLPHQPTASAALIKGVDRSGGAAAAQAFGDV